MRRISLKVPSLIVVSLGLAFALFLFVTSSSGAYAATTVVSPRNVPVPAQATWLRAITVRTDGEFATQHKYTVNDTDPGPVISFYHEVMPEYGWTLVSSGPTGPDGGQVLKYRQGQRICYVQAFSSQEISGNTTLFLTVTN